MTISSRTPEGEPNTCPVCGHDLRLEPSIDTRDAPCLSCGYLLWFRNPRREDLALSCKNENSILMRMGLKRWGPLPAELKARFIRAITKMCPKDDIQDERDLPLLVAEIASISKIENWNALVTFLEERAQVPGTVVLDRDKYSILVKELKSLWPEKR